MRPAAALQAFPVRNVGIQLGQADSREELEYSLSVMPMKTPGRLSPAVSGAHRHAPAPPGDFEQQPVLRVQHRRLPRRDAEEVRVELVDLVEKATPARCILPGREPSTSYQRLRPSG